MGSEKAEIKALVAHELGVGLDDMLEAVQVEAHQYRGAKEGLRQAVLALNQYHKDHIDKDIDEGKLSLEEATQIRRYLERDVGILENLAVRAEVSQLQAEGKSAGVRLAVQNVKKYHDRENGLVLSMRAQEQAAAQAALTPADEVAPTNGLGKHPGPTLKAKRIAEAKKTTKRPRGKNT
jgi:hypothetical protein